MCRYQHGGTNSKRHPLDPWSGLVCIVRYDGFIHLLSMHATLGGPLCDILLFQGCTSPQHVEINTYKLVQSWRGIKKLKESMDTRDGGKWTLREHFNSYIVETNGINQQIIHRSERAIDDRIFLLFKKIHSKHVGTISQN